MSCFLGCFGVSMEGKPRKNPNVGHQYQYQPNEPTRPSIKSQFGVKSEEKQMSSIKWSKPEDNVNPFSFPIWVFSLLCVLLLYRFRVKPKEKTLSSIKQSKSYEKQLSSGSHKKATFDSNVKEYEHISVDEAPEIKLESEKEVEKKHPHETSITPSKSLSVSGGGSTLSSLGSFPTNHRYQNCGESDDEEEELDCQLSDVDKYEDVLGEDDDDDEYSEKTTIGLEPAAYGGGGASGSSSDISNEVKSHDQTPTMEEDSGLAASFRGIPNTTSKYREDKSVTWHSTPFETMLERALNKGAGPGRASCGASHGSNSVKSREETPTIEEDLGQLLHLRH